VVEKPLKNLIPRQFDSQTTCPGSQDYEMITLLAAIQECHMPPLVSEGLNLALYGMGTVFVFLTLLVLATMLMSWLVAHWETAAVVALPADSAGTRKMAAITAAIHQHRNR
jgi:oxaloacetate decarboxylase gamma subunit